MARQQQWIVDFADGAVRDLEDVKAKDERKAVFNAIDKLRQLGPRLTPPHIKALAGETDLFALRPKQGNSKTRPIVVRQDVGYLVIAVVADNLRVIIDGWRELATRHSVSSWPTRSRTTTSFARSGCDSRRRGSSR